MIPSCVKCKCGKYGALGTVTDSVLSFVSNMDLLVKRVQEEEDAKSNPAPAQSHL
jgi:hypothetical protein